MRPLRRAILAILIAVAAPAAARPPAPDAAARERDARDHYAKGMTHFNLGEFAAAVAEFKLAYAASSAPGLLFNMAQAQRLNREYEAALFSYQTYLRLVPRAPNRKDVEARIVEVEAAVKEEAGRRAAADREAAAQREAAALREEAARREAAKPTLAPVRSEIPPPPRADPPSGKWLLRLGIAAAVLGAAALGVGGILGVRAKAEADELTDLSRRGGTWDAHAQALEAEGPGLAAGATALFVAGGVLVAGGVAAALWGWRREAAPRLAVGASPAGAALVARWAF
jgi:hypothetical protein